ncbi:MAG: hypothetical protein Q4C42_08915 [Clostridia bacterium]|nr:hypothetical protein [Clostridia bacterium]
MRFDNTVLDELIPKEMFGEYLSEYDSDVIAVLVAARLAKDIELQRQWKGNGFYISILEAEAIMENKTPFHIFKADVLEKLEVET